MLLLNTSVILLLVNELPADSTRLQMSYVPIFLNTVGGL